MDFSGIDVFKLIMSFAVVAIHAPEYLWPNEREYSFFIDWFIRLAVPFYFVTSGFLISKKLKLTHLKGYEKSIYLRKKSVRLLRLWTIWLIVYASLSIYGGYKSELTIAQKVIGYLYDVFLTGHSLYSQQLWYLYSMAIVTLIWSLVINNKYILNLLTLIFLSLSIYAWMADRGIVNADKISYCIATWMLGGGLPILAGAFIERHIGNYVNVNFQNTIITVMLTVSILLKYIGFPMWTLVGGAGIFLFSYNLKLGNHLNFIEIRKESMWIYYIHMYVVITTMVVVIQFNIAASWLSLLLFDCIISWLIAKFLYHVGNTRELNILNVLIK